MVIASQCLEYMSVTDLAEVENAINNAIKNSRERTREENLERIRVMFADYELVEVMTILELTLWKAKVDSFGDLEARTREAMSSVEQISSFQMFYLSFDACGRKQSWGLFFLGFVLRDE